MHKSPPTGIWGGLWTPLSSELDENCKQFILHNYGFELSNETPLPKFRHTFSHFHLLVHPIISRIGNLNPEIGVINENNCQWHSVDNWLVKGIPAAVRTMLLQLQESFITTD